MTREEYIKANTLESVLRDMGFAINGRDKYLGKCPFHEDKSPSFSVDIKKGLWNCFAGCGGGSVIDLVAKRDGISPRDVLQRASSTTTQSPARLPKAPTVPKEPQETLVLTKTYAYHNALGAEVYQALRYEPKTFRQRHSNGKGGWTYSMEGVERVLYRLPEVLKSQQVAIAEGEKDAETLVGLGYCGTCHVGGAKAWLDAYAESLSGKDLLLFSDNDDPGQEWKQQVFDACAGKCKTVRVIKLPLKDVSDYVGTFKTTDEAKRALAELIDTAHPFISGVQLPIYSLAELEPAYARYATSAESSALDLSRWLPGIGLRWLCPGELVLIVGDTGTGKTGVLTNIAIAARPLRTLFFELELSLELTFERALAASARKFTCSEIEQNYRNGHLAGPDMLTGLMPHVYFCHQARISLPELETIILRSELKIGERPKVVLIDYVQLIQGQGKRYERMSDIAEGLRVLARATRTIIVIASQIARPEGDTEVHLHSAKDSGALESSASLVIGIWRDEEQHNLMHLRILKSTKGGAGRKLEIEFDPARMQIGNYKPKTSHATIE